MARIEGSTGSLAEVDTGSLAQRVSARPQRVLAWNNINATTGLVTAAAAGGTLFSIRNTGTNLVLIKRLGIGAVLTTAFTAAQLVDFAAMIARAWSTNDSGGTDVTPTGNDAKRRTSLTTPSGIHIRVATTAGMTAGTRSLDAQAVGRHVYWGGAVGAGIEMEPYNLLTADQPGDLPIVLAQNEGVVVTNVTLMGAAGVQRVYIHCDYAEVTPTDFA